MTSSSQRLPLRILYTINSSPQYILAKSPAAYAVDIIQTDARHHGVAHIYASTALKHCLHTICRSSPELVQDNSRDFSVYVLDPLESNSAPAPVHISDSTSKNADASSDSVRGVAVGFGLMSWALRSEDESVQAVGTLVKSSGSESLEVVFALRETVSKTFPIWNAPTTISHQISQLVNMMSHPQQNAIASTTSVTPSSSNQGSYSHPASTQKSQRSSSRAEPKSRAKPKKPVPTTGSDKLLDAPEVYIGPQKKKGRPKVTRVDNTTAFLTTGKGKAKADAIVVDDDCSTPANQGTYRASSSQVLLAPTPVQTAQAKVEPGDDAKMFHVLKLLSGSSPESEAQKAVILTALNSIDSTSDTDSNSNPLLISALKQLVAMCANGSHPEASLPHATAPPYSHPPANEPDQDDEIIVLDKENVNPVVFNKKRREYSDAKLQEAGGVPSSGTHSVPATRTPSFTLKSRSNGASPPQSLSRSNGGVSVGAARKRTLSDFMDERDSNRNRDRLRDRERAEKRESHRHAFLQRRAYRHYCLDAELPTSDNSVSYYQTALEPWTSPVRPTEDNPDLYLADSETKGPDFGPTRSSTRPAKTAASSPIRGTKVDSSHSKKKYIVPAWARTNTATQPRLSEEAQQALKEAEERKRLERLENRKKSCSGQERARRKREQGLQSATASSSTSSAAPSRSSSIHPPIPPAPTVGPLVAAANISPLAALFSSPRRRSPSPTGRFTLPQTPTRPRKSGHLTSGGLGDSLFTPGSRNGSIFGSARTPLFSPEVGYGTSGSPLNHKKIKRSPRTPWCSPPRLPNFNIHLTASKSERHDAEDTENADADLDKELDAAFADLDAPPSSLPTACSDTEIGDIFSPSSASVMLSSSQDQTTGDGEEESEQRPQREIWEGLPPSSPPPPSSPTLLHSDTNDDEMEDLELPVATSDIETDFTDLEGALSMGGEGRMCSEDEITLSENDFSMFFAMEQSSDQPMQSEDVFEQFTNINARSDMTHGSSDQTINNTTLGDIDFSGFWQNFNPLLEGHVLSAELGDNGLGFDCNDMKNGGEVDHEGLARDVKALFSGCVM